MKTLKSYLIPSLITATTTLVVLVAAKPFGVLLDSFLKLLEVRTEKQLLLQLTVSLLIVLLGMLSYIFHLRKKYHYKKRFRFGIYWKEHSPFCPHCGGRLVEGNDYVLTCVLCKQRLKIYFGASTHISLKQAIDELEKDGQ